MVLSSVFEKRSFRDKVVLLGQCWFGICSPVTGGFDTLDSAVDRAHAILNVLTGASGLVAVAMIVYSGYTLITSGGNADALESSMKTITASVAGLIVIFLARLIIQFVIDRVL